MNDIPAPDKIGEKLYNIAVEVNKWLNSYCFHWRVSKEAHGVAVATFGELCDVLFEYANLKREKENV